MSTLFICVSDPVDVEDIALQVKGLFVRILDFFLDKKIEMVPQETIRTEEVRGPPTLGVSVAEDVHSKDRFG